MQEWSLSCMESRPTGMSILYSVIVYASDGAWVSAFVHVYAEISGRKSDKGFRKAVMDFRCLKQSSPINRRLLIKGAFFHGEILRALVEINACKVAGHNDIFPVHLTHMI